MEVNQVSNGKWDEAFKKAAAETDKKFAKEIKELTTVPDGIVPKTSKYDLTYQEPAKPKKEHGFSFTVNDFSSYKTGDNFTTYGIRAEKEVIITKNNWHKFSAIGGKQITFNSESIHFEPGLGAKFQLGGDEQLIRAYTSAMGTLNIGVLDGKFTGGIGVRGAVGGEVGPLYAEGFIQKATNYTSHGVAMGLRLKF